MRSKCEGEETHASICGAQRGGFYKVSLTECTRCIVGEHYFFMEFTQL